MNNHYLESVEHNEKDRILRIGKEFESLHLGEKTEDKERRRGNVQKKTSRNRAKRTG